MQTSLGSFIYAIYISKYTQTACWAGWENRNTSGEGHQEKKRTGKQELFTFNNSVAFNVSIYIQTLSIYVQTVMGSERSLFQTQNTKAPWWFPWQMSTGCRAFSIYKADPTRRADSQHLRGTCSPAQRCVFPTSTRPWETKWKLAVQRRVLGGQNRIYCVRRIFSMKLVNKSNWSCCQGTV